LQGLGFLATALGNVEPLVREGSRTDIEDLFLDEVAE
jgi:hypothetical protein